MSNLHKNRFLNQLSVLICLILFVWIYASSHKKKHRHLDRNGRPVHSFTERTCLNIDTTLRAKHKTCFLRPDTGPCRADILSWYFDVKKRKCYRFFWGGCQGNGNRFETKMECHNYCYLDLNTQTVEIPNFCSLSFDYGRCFGHYNRWGWDKLAKTCKRHIYSGCGGNQNNFETREECMKTCLSPPNNTLVRSRQYTTCVPFQIQNLQ